MNYIGHVISKKMVEVDISKIQVMVDWLKPMIVKDVHDFLGLVGYYRKFNSDFGNIATPLTQCLGDIGFC